jgi:hypothetical protein
LKDPVSSERKRRPPAENGGAGLLADTGIDRSINQNTNRLGAPLTTKIAQMDVKGAYLNGNLQEEVSMRQPEGYDDGTGKVCHLIKTLYGLKQAGREWNKNLDARLKGQGFENLHADPCAYIRETDDHIEVITVWVDDLLLFGDRRICSGWRTWVAESYS